MQVKRTLSVGEYVFATVLDSLIDTPVERRWLRFRDRHIMHAAHNLRRINATPSHLSLSTPTGHRPEEYAHLIFFDFTLFEEIIGDSVDAILIRNPSLGQSSGTDSELRRDKSDSRPKEKYTRTQECHPLH